MRTCCIDCGEPMGWGFRAPCCGSCRDTRAWEYASGTPRAEIAAITWLLHDILDSELGAEESPGVPHIARVRTCRDGLLLTLKDGQRLDVTITTWQPGEE